MIVKNAQAIIIILSFIMIKSNTLWIKVKKYIKICSKRLDFEGLLKNV